MDNDDQYLSNIGDNIIKVVGLYYVNGNDNNVIAHFSYYDNEGSFLYKFSTPNFQNYRFVTSTSPNGQPLLVISKPREGNQSNADILFYTFQILKA
ncbi:MAG: hypothetical protein ACI86M_001999 [Saprospiraceae bacterium]|jgi:hypothetical protein